jgi:hypothetical protein
MFYATSNNITITYGYHMSNLELINYQTPSPESMTVPVKSKGFPDLQDSL